MWILGGTEDYLFAPDGSRLRNDVWHTADGENWIRATESAAWAPRALHQALAFDGRIWILGGGNYQPEMEVRNDVWCSEDGVRWTRVLEHAPWPARIWFSSAVYRDRMWVMGGSARGNELLADCWYSKDGIEWAELRSEAVWTPRHEHSTFVHRDRIWVAGGHARPLNSEVWSLHLPEDWFREE
jgi:hypothetical protein